jgi:hypothetical protein
MGGEVETYVHHGEGGGVETYVHHSEGDESCDITQNADIVLMCIFIEFCARGGFQIKCVR